MSCIGAAENFPHGDCYLHMDGNLTCTSDGLSAVQNKYAIDQIDNCEAYKHFNNRQVIAWCYAERAHRFGEIDKCLSYAISDEEKDYCYYQRATILSDLKIDYCNAIKKEPMKLGCQTTIRAWIKYPELKPATDQSIPTSPSRI
jgi:hypothetical protein